MSLPASYTMSLYAGDDDPFLIRYKNSDGSLIDLTGFSAKMDFKLAACDTAALSVVGVIDTPASGEIVFPISGAVKQGLIIDCQTTCYLYDVELTQPSAGIKTILRGTARIKEDITE